MVDVVVIGDIAQALITDCLSLLILSNFRVPVCSGLQPPELCSAQEQVRTRVLVAALVCHQPRG